MKVNYVKLHLGVLVELWEYGKPNIPEETLDKPDVTLIMVVALDVVQSADG